LHFFFSFSSLTDGALLANSSSSSLSRFCFQSPTGRLCDGFSFGLFPFFLSKFPFALFPLVGTMTTAAASPAAAADAAPAASAPATRPTRPDENAFKEALAKAEKEHKAAMDKFVCPAVL
jgi:hypothetical protein